MRWAFPITPTTGFFISPFSVLLPANHSTIMPVEGSRINIGARGAECHFRESGQASDRLWRQRTAVTQLDRGPNLSKDWAKCHAVKGIDVTIPVDRRLQARSDLAWAISV